MTGTKLASNAEKRAMRELADESKQALKIAVSNHITPLLSALTVAVSASSNQRDIARLQKKLVDVQILVSRLGETFS